MLSTRFFTLSFCKHFRKNISPLQSGQAHVPKGKELALRSRQKARLPPDPNRCHPTQTETCKNLIPRRTGNVNARCNAACKCLPRDGTPSTNKDRDATSRDRSFASNWNRPQSPHRDALRPGKKSRTMAGYDCDMHRSLVF